MSKTRITKEIKAELARLAERSKDHRLHWQDIIRAARNKSNPLHSYFDWSHKAAMEHYIKAQAQNLIVSYYATIVHPVNGEKVRTRAFVSLTSDRKEGGGYRSVLSVLSDEQLKEQLLLDALADLAAFKQRYKQLRELAELFQEIENLEQRYAATAKRRSAPRVAAEARAVGG